MDLRVYKIALFMCQTLPSNTPCYMGPRSLELTPVRECLIVGSHMLICVVTSLSIGEEWHVKAFQNPVIEQTLVFVLSSKSL
jgi:hypothetical protein